ncbi:hypothetical protein B0H12DRAFT_1241171 [Mycena haematopus]|nr:hypothetical protein B0H12DRAFT_1241171 [Mycena haematopus]
MNPDLVLSLVFPRANYGVSSFFPLRRRLRLELTRLRLELALLNRPARYLTLPESHGVSSLISDALRTLPKLPIRVPSAPSSASPAPTRTGYAQTRLAAAPARSEGGQSTSGLSPILGDRRVPLAAHPVTYATKPLQPVDPLQPVVATHPPGGHLSLSPPSSPTRNKEEASTVLDGLAMDPVLDGLAMDEGFAQTQSTWFTDGSLLDSEGRAGGAAIHVMHGTCVYPVSSSIPGVLHVFESCHGVHAVVKILKRGEIPRELHSFPRLGVHSQLVLVLVAGWAGLAIKIGQVLEVVLVDIFKCGSTTSRSATTARFGLSGTKSRSSRSISSASSCSVDGCFTILVPAVFLRE